MTDVPCFVFPCREEEDASHCAVPISTGLIKQIVNKAGSEDNQEHILGYFYGLRSSSQPPWPYVSKDSDRYSAAHTPHSTDRHCGISMCYCALNRQSFSNKPSLRQRTPPLRNITTFVIFIITINLPSCFIVNRRLFTYWPSAHR